jgi:hypothetical protein
MQHDATLLKTQKNDVFRMLTQADLRPGEFAWDTKKYTRYDRGQTTYTISVLSHAPTGYFCEFLYSGGLNYSPGEERMVEFRQAVGDWRDVRDALHAWVEHLKRELKAPDPWADLQRDAVDRLSNAERANAALRSGRKETAARELREANADLSRLQPDLHWGHPAFTRCIGMCSPRSLRG